MAHHNAQTNHSPLCGCAGHGCVWRQHLRSPRGDDIQRTAQSIGQHQQRPRHGTCSIPCCWRPAQPPGSRHASIATTTQLPQSTRATAGDPTIQVQRARSHYIRGMSSGGRMYCNSSMENHQDTCDNVYQRISELHVAVQYAEAQLCHHVTNGAHQTVVPSTALHDASIDAAGSRRKYRLLPHLRTAYSTLPTCAA